MSGLGVGGRSDRQRGATLVEFALIAPLLFLLLFGIIEFGRAIATYSSVFTAAREGARFATTIGDRNSDGIPNYADCADIRAAAKSRAVLVTLSDDNILITYDSGPDEVDVAVCQGVGDLPTPDNILAGSRITVTVTSEFRSPIPLISNIIGTLEPESRQSRTIFRGSE